MPLRALVVDDDRDNADSFALLLRLSGVEAEAVYSAEDALISAVQLRPHVALLDLVMPGTDGFCLAALLRERWPHMFISLCSGYAGPDLRRRAMESQVDAILTKPVLWKDLQQAVLQPAAARVLMRSEGDAKLRMRAERRASVAASVAGEPLVEAIRSANSILNDAGRATWERVRATDTIAQAMRRRLRKSGGQH